MMPAAAKFNHLVAGPGPFRDQKLRACCGITGPRFRRQRLRSLLPPLGGPGLVAGDSSRPGPGIPGHPAGPGTRITGIPRLDDAGRLAGSPGSPALAARAHGPDRRPRQSRVPASPSPQLSERCHGDEGRRARESLPMFARAVRVRGATAYRCLSGKVLHKARDPGRCRARYTNCNTVAAADPPVMKDPSHSDDRR